MANDNLDTAISCFQQGKPDQALKILNNLIKSKNTPSITWFIKAIIHAQKNEYENAIKSFKKALIIQPIYPDAHNNMAVTYEKQNKTDKAIKHYQLAITQKPDYTNALFNLGNINHNIGDYSAAEKHYLLAIKYDPQYIKAYNNLGLLYQQLKQPDQARICFEKALAINPNDFEVLSNIGGLYSSENNDEKALEFHQKSIQINPDNPKTLNNIGVTLQSLQRYDEAEQHFNHAISIQNNYSEAYSNLGNLYKETNKIPLAKEYYLKALEINHTSSVANTNYGLLLHLEGQYDEAKKHYKTALEGNNNYKEARYNLGTTQLASKDFISGWKNYLYRPSQRHHLAADINLIDTNDLKDKHILLLKEQGIGDELFFLRFAPQLKKTCTKLSYLATPKIAPFAREFRIKNNIDNVFDEVFEDEKKCINYDVAISIADLPALLGQDVTPESMGLNIPKEHINEISEMLSGFGSPPYIGITWRGGQQSKNMLYKTIPIDQLINSLEKIDATFISLQRQPGKNELDEIRKNPRFSTMPDMGHLNEDLPKMLALLSLLDDYIGVSNTNMHLNAAIGKTAKVLVPHPPEWRWMLNDKTSPWFPGYEVYRESPDGNWTDALSQLKHQLQNQYG